MSDKPDAFCAKLQSKNQFIGSKHDRVTCATKQIERDSKDTDATNSYPEKVQIKLGCNTLQK